MHNQTEQAIKYHKLGLNTIPIRLPGEEYISNGEEKVAEGKEPRIKWSHWKIPGYRPQTIGHVKRLFPRDSESNIACIGGMVSGNALALDFDDRETFTDLARKNPYIEYLLKNTLSDRTRRGFHLWLRTDKPVKSTRIDSLNLDIKGEGGYWLAPNSVWKRDHQIGNYLWESWNEILTVPISELEWLGAREATVQETHNFLGIGPRRWNVLRGESKAKDRSKAEFSLVLSLVANGETREYVHELFRRYAGTNTHYHEHDTPIQWLDNVYAKATEYYFRNASTFDLQTIAYMQMAKEIPFKRYTDRIALLALLQKTREVGKTRINISVRELSESLNVGRDSASNALRNLTEAGYIERIVRGMEGLSSTFDILPVGQLQTATDGNMKKVEHTIEDNISKVGHTNTVSPPYGVSGFCNINNTRVYLPSKDISNFFNIDKLTVNPTRESSLDGYAYRSLGKTGLRIVEYLNSNVGEWFTLSQLKNGTGVSYNTIKQKMVDLGSLVSVEEIPSRGRTGTTKRYAIFRTITNSDVETIADRFGVAGTAERRKNRHDREREAYLTRLSERGNQ